MKTIIKQKWFLFFLLCVVLFGLILLKLPPNPEERDFYVSSQSAEPGSAFDHINHAFAIDTDISSTCISVINVSPSPLIDKSLVSLLSANIGKPQSAYRTLVTNVEDYEVEAGKPYTIFYDHPSSLPDPYQQMVDELCSELYDTPSITRKQELRAELKKRLKDAEFAPTMQRVILRPPRNRHDVSERTEFPIIR